MPWRKLGLVLEPPTHLPWSASHAAVPLVDVSDGGIDLYFSTRDSDGRSHVARAALDIAAGRADVSSEPVLRPGALGTFDDSGVMASSIVRDGGRTYLYYTGWLRGTTVPFYTYTGLAVDDGDGEFVRTAQVPILDRSDVDPYMAHSAWVMKEGSTWRMWYSSATEWRMVGGLPRHRYLIKYAESQDGVSWQRSGLVCIDYRNDAEYALSRPCVVNDDGTYRMWFSARGDTYRVWHAVSTDGLSWERTGNSPELAPSESGWDSEAVCYACVFDLGGDRRMLYNGNGYGATGIGHAVQEG